MPKFQVDMSSSIYQTVDFSQHVYTFGEIQISD